MNVLFHAIVNLKLAQVGDPGMYVNVTFRVVVSQVITTSDKLISPPARRRRSCCRFVEWLHRIGERADTVLCPSTDRTVLLLQA